MKKKIPIIFVSAIFSLIIWGSISLSGDYYANIYVKLKLTDFPKGYSTASNLPDNISIKLKGEGWKLLSLNIGKDVNYIVPVQKDSGKKIVNLKNYLTDNRWILSDLELIDIQPDTLSFIIERMISRKLPVFVDMQLDFKPGYGLATSIKVEPDSVIVSGPLSLISKINKVKTKLLKLNSLDEEVTKTIGFADLPGTKFSIRSVHVTLDIQRIVDKEFDDIIVNVLDVPPDRDVILLPNKIGCSVRGGINILGKLKKEEFNAFVFYREVMLDTLGSVVPHFEIPENTHLLYIKPERLRYVIKKFR
ncbi:YbbR-like protein [bacterium BMS3Abin03]|nr:YbbR-like protein [bacterium BMS3Abin03]